MTAPPSIDALIANLERLKQWCRAQDPNATIWLHIDEAVRALAALTNPTPELQPGSGSNERLGLAPSIDALRDRVEQVARIIDPEAFAALDKSLIKYRQWVEGSPVGRKFDPIIAKAEAILASLSPAEDVERYREAINLALHCTPSIQHGVIVYDCGDPWEILRTALDDGR
jgi:hypothetical protein